VGLLPGAAVALGLTAIVGQPTRGSVAAQRASAVPRSAVFDQPGERPPVDELSEPDFFVDLNLDQVLASVTAGREEYDLTALFYTPLHSVAGVHYGESTLSRRLRDELARRPGP
jgi:hypothetical protein